MSPTIVAFGNFDLQGARSWVIRTGLQEQGFAIVLCRTEAKGLLPKYRDLRKQWDTCKKDASAIYVPFLGHYLLPLAWWLGKKKKIPVVFDAFLSLYDTEVNDRRRVARISPKAIFLWLVDWLCCKLATLVLIDTEEHRAYFIKVFVVPVQKIIVLPIGHRTDLFKPAHHPENDPFLVTFYGTFIPLQGIETILRAAKELDGEQITFQIIGKGQTYPEMIKLAQELGLKNVQFLGSIPMQDLPTHLQKADACLGIFGTSEKADRVIPNKAYDILALGQPLITGKTMVAKRVFQDRENALLSTPGDPRELAACIRLLKQNTKLRHHIAKGGLQLSQSRFQPSMIVGPLVEWLHSHI